MEIIHAESAAFRRREDGTIVMLEDGTEREIGTITSAFPLSKPERIVVLKHQQGNEIGILDRLRPLDKESRGVLKQELEKSYFMPRIHDIVEKEERLRVVTMEVVTNRGERTFQVRNVRQNIRKMGRGRIIIKDVDGNRYEIPEWQDLPEAAQETIREYL